MPNASRQSGARATGSLSGRFHHARVRLTLFYVAILAAILFLSSSIIYSDFSGRLQHRYEGFQPSFERMYQPGGGTFTLPVPQDVQQDLVHTLEVVNGLLLVVAGLFSYWLAGVTLVPIQEAYERQRRFLGDASHELRTPLTILQTDLENELEDSQVKGASRERAESHLEEIGRMGRLVADLLTLSRLDEEETQSQPELAPVDLAAVLAEAVERLQGVAARHQVRLEYVRPEGAALRVLAEPELLHKILANIIKNAIVYNREGGTVTVKAEREQGMAKVGVADTGIGIRKQDIGRIAERFYRSDQSRSRQTGGSGLGLSIVQAALSRVGGSMSIESVLGKGTTVTLLFPLG